jgi:hypothetical protein
MTVKFVPPRVPLVDPRTGLISREWYRLFADVFSATTGASVADDFGVDPAIVGNPEILALLGVVAQSAGQQAGIEALQARVAELEKGIDDLRKGTVVL